MSSQGKSLASQSGEGQLEMRFEFGANWQNFLRTLNDARIAEAVASVQFLFKAENFAGKTFIDVGSGSGLFSLAAKNLQARRLHSFDYDSKSVACTQELKRRFFPAATQWTVEQGSVLDKAYISSLGQFDYVYSWGVLHHTGNMMQAFTNVTQLVKPGGELCIAIYNRQPLWSPYWTFVKRLYNRLPRFGQSVLALGFYIFYAVLLGVADMLRGRNPVHRYFGQGFRGMTLYYDVVDWIGGYPFEVASPEEVFRFFRDRGFTLKEMITCAGKQGCNQFVFQRAK